MDNGNAIQLVAKKRCTGCTACANICPHHAISMKADKEGFSYPEIDSARCKECHLCEKVCSAIFQQDPIHPGKEALACFSRNTELRDRSSSGGVFSEIAGKILTEGGVVFGAAFDTDFTVRHTFVERLEDLDRLRRSKYVQSQIGENYQACKTFLQKGRTVMFVGTPCQIRGLHCYLGGKEYPNLLTVDFICHGVPSPGIWSRYLAHLKEKHHSPIADISFRNKTHGWLFYSFAASFLKGETYSVLGGDDPFVLAFFRNLTLRRSCYHCHQKKNRSGSDLTIADFWGIEKMIPEWNDDKGVSLVRINTPCGSEFLNGVKEQWESCSVDYHRAVQGNSCAEKSTRENMWRSLFFHLIGRGVPLMKVFAVMPMLYWIQDMCNLPGRVVRKIRRILFKK